MLTDLVLYLNATNDGLGRQLTTAAPAAEALATTKTGAATGYGELTAQGSAAAWPGAAGGPPVPSGKGFLWNVTTLESQFFAVGLWRPSLKLAVMTGAIVADIYARVWKLTAGGTYEAIATAVAPGTVIAAGAPVAVQVPAAVGGVAEFLTGEKLYLDVILNITANTSANPDATTSLYMNGGAAEMLLTPGYDESPESEPDTVLDLITDALIDLNAIQQGDELSAEDADVGMRRLNVLVDRMNADRLSYNSIATQTLPLSANKGTYTIGKKTGGPASDFNQARPILIQTASIVIGGLRHPLDPQTARQWAANSEPGAAAQLPQKLYCDYKWPVASLNFNPAPTCTNPTSVEMFFWQPLPLFTALTDVIDLPPAYRAYLKYNLSLALALPFMKQPSDLLVQYAVNSKAEVRAFNAMQLAGMVSEATTGEIPQTPAPVVDPTRPQPPAGG